MSVKDTFLCSSGEVVIQPERESYFSVLQFSINSPQLDDTTPLTATVVQLLDKAGTGGHTVTGSEEEPVIHNIKVFITLHCVVL